MIKIQSSYRLIKNKNISDDKAIKNLSDIEYKIELPEKEEELIDSEDDFLEEDKDEDLSYEEKIRKDIEGQIIREVEEKRENILNNALEEAESVRQKAYEEGFERGQSQGLEEGFEQGYRKGEEEANKNKEKALDYMSQVDNYVKDYIRESEKDIISLAITIAERIIDFEMEDREETILNIIRPVIQEYNKQDKIIISCNSKRYDFVKKHLDEFKNLSPETQFVVFKDDNLGENDCVIESDNQYIDLSIKKQLDSIFNTIRHME